MAAVIGSTPACADAPGASLTRMLTLTRTTSEMQRRWLVGRFPILFLGNEHPEQGCVGGRRLNSLGWDVGDHVVPDVGGMISMVGTSHLLPALVAIRPSG